MSLLRRKPTRPREARPDQGRARRADLRPPLPRAEPGGDRPRGGDPGLAVGCPTSRSPSTSRSPAAATSCTPRSENATTLKPNSPVRIAGVNVGEVTSVEPEGNMAEATFTVADEGLPIHKDATITIRPRLFLEGNFFLDLQPGSPSAPDLSSGRPSRSPRPPTAVQIDQILTSLQKDTRKSLKRALAGYGKALNQAPTAAQDATQDPDVQGLTGGRGDQPDLPLRRQGGSDDCDRQPGAPRPAPARPLEPDPRPARPVHQARLDRRVAAAT